MDGILAAVDFGSIVVVADVLLASAAVTLVVRGTRISTRRFSDRPAAVALDAIGAKSPRPAAVMRSGEMPSCAKVRKMDSARAVDSARLSWNAPLLIGWASGLPETMSWWSACVADSRCATSLSSGSDAGRGVAEPL